VDDNGCWTGEIGGDGNANGRTDRKVVGVCDVGSDAIVGLARDNDTVRSVRGLIAIVEEGIVLGRVDV